MTTSQSNKTPKSNYKIPKILHFIWILGPNNTGKSDIPNKFYDLALTTLSLIKKANKKDKSKWQINLWVDQNIEQLTNVKKLEKKGFKVKNINEVLFDVDPTEAGKSYSSEYQKKLFNIAYVHGIRVDIVKYQVLKKYGGVINDFNFIYKRLPQQ